MTTTMRTVTVHQVPEEVTASSARSFLSDLQQYVETERPRLVLDCSRVCRMTDATVHLLLSCLEEGMKRNGDVKLSSLSPQMEAVLRTSGVDRLFEIYATPAAAVHSFRSYFHGDPAAGMITVGTPRASENAA